MRKLLFPFILGALTLAVIAAFTEASVRLLADDGLQFDLEMWKYARDVKVVSPDPLIGHEHGANRSAKLMGVEFETNSQGLRDREHNVERQPGVPRILMLGDSLTVGWGVPVDATFSKRIERLFAEKGAKVEVINTGVGNWNTVQETEYFLTKGHLYRPDVVVLNYFINDAEPVPQSRSPSFLMRHCFACVFLKGRYDALLRQFSARKTWQDYYFGLYDGGSGPGWLAAKSALQRLAEYCKANGITLIVANLPELHDVENYQFGVVTDLVQGAARENGVQFVDLLPLLRKHESSDLWVTRPDPHPNALAHDVIAQGLFEVLSGMHETDGVVQRPPSVTSSSIN
jgi:hypothetical protein